MMPKLQRCPIVEAYKKIPLIREMKNEIKKKKNLLVENF